MACHETLNGWLKTWRILSQVFRHRITMHGDVFPACTVHGVDAAHLRDR